MQGKTCVITGGTSGIGRAVALALANLGANLFLLGRDSTAGQAVARALEAKPRSGSVEFIQTDLSIQKDVREAAHRICDQVRAVDVLINNAGARFDTFRTSPEGLELTFATNHLGHFLLTQQLLSALLRAPTAAVIMITSRAHRGVSGKFNWLPGAENYDRKTAYAASKLANLIFTYQLADHLKNTRVVANAVDPGIVLTGFAQNNGFRSWARHLVSHAVRGELTLPRTAARPIVRLATDNSDSRANGKCFLGEREVQTSEASHDPGLGAGLWALSLSLSKLTEDDWNPARLKERVPS